MIRSEMLDRMSGEELLGWQARYAVAAEEHEDQRHRLESGDGQVHVYGRDEPDEDDGDTDGDTAGEDPGPP